MELLKEIIGSYSGDNGGRVGMPIGNLTSQIFANIYLNELDRFVKYELKLQINLKSDRIMKVSEGLKFLG